MSDINHIYEEIVQCLEFIDKNDDYYYPPNVKKLTLKTLNEYFNKVDFRNDIKNDDYCHYYKKIMKFAKHVPLDKIKKIFVYVCIFGDIDFVKYILTREDAVYINKYGFNSDTYDGFGFACRNGNYEVVKLLIDTFSNISVTAESCINMIKANNYYGFRLACWGGHIEIVKLLIEIFYSTTINSTKRVIEEMNAADNYFGFRYACCNGHIEIVKLLIETFGLTCKSSLNGTQGISAELEKMNIAGNYYGFCYACCNGHIEIVKLLIETFGSTKVGSTKGVIEKMNAAGNYLGFLFACYGGHIEVIELLIETFEDVEMIATDTYYFLYMIYYNSDDIEASKKKIEKYKKILSNSESETKPSVDKNEKIYKRTRNE